MANGHSYTDPVYGTIEARLEKKYGLTPGLMGRIRTRGERSNADQVSEADARTVYQIIPDTRAGAIKNWGIDAYKDKESAAEVAALILRDSKRRNGGSEDKAVLEYHGGLDRSQWGERTRAYGQRVSGRATPTAGDGYTPSYYKDEPIKDFSGDWLHSRPQDPSTRPMPKHIAKESSVDKQERLNLHTLGTKDINATADGIDNSAVGLHDLREGERAATAQTIEDNKITPMQRLIASWHDNTITAAMLRHFDDNSPDTPEPGFTDHYMQNRDKIEEGADDDERHWLRTATSIEGLASIQKDIAARRERRSLYTAHGATQADSVLLGLVGGLADPVGLAAGAGVGKLFESIGVGSRALYLARRPVMGTISQAGENALANTAIVGGMDASGDYYTSKDYATAAAFGATLGMVASPISRFMAARSAKVPNATADLFTEQAANAKKEVGELFTRAEKNLGPDATPDAVAAEARRLDREDHVNTIKIALADQPDNVKLLNGENVLTKDPALLEDITKRYDLEGVSDETERSFVAEMIARSERGMEGIDVKSERLNPMTRWFGAQSTGVDLLRSKSPVARFFGAITTEGTTGAAGRRRTAAMAQSTRERVYNSELRGYASLYHLYRKEKGVGLASEAVDGNVYKQFEREVFLEIEGRGDETAYAPHPNPLVREAADMVESGMEKMRLEQQHVGTAGAARLGDTSRGYIPHRLQGTEVLKLTNAQRASVRRILSEQFQSEGNAFTRKDGTTRAMDKEFADKLAAKYLERGMDKAKGGYDVPINLQDPNAAEMLQDALEAMGVKYPEAQDMMGKFSRAGAGHTKKRLRLDLNADIGDGKKLVDLYDTSVGNLYRGYSRRTSGEVALAQFGILGRKGLMEARKAMMHTGADIKELKAFDQVASEFLNMPFGDLNVSNHKYMDNLRIATSLARLGGMGFTQMAEYGNGINALGVHRVMAGVADMPRLMAEVRAINKGHPSMSPWLKDIDTLGGDLGMDGFTNTRLFEVKDNDIQMYGTESLGLGSRALRAGQHLHAVASGHRMILAVQVRGMAEQIVRKTIKYVEKGINDKALDDMGIDATLRGRLKENLSSIARYEGKDLVGLDLTKGDLTGHEIMSLRDAVERGSSQIIQRTYIGETGIWAHDGMLKLLTQFRTFGITSIEKQWGRQYHTHGLKNFAYMTGAFSWCIPIYMARMELKMAGMNKADADKFADTHLTPMAIAMANLNYMSSTGLLSDALDLGTGVMGGAFGMELGDDLGARGQYRGGLVGGAIAPGVGLANDLFDGVKNGKSSKLLKAMPGSSLPFVQPAVSAITAN